MNRNCRFELRLSKGELTMLTRKARKAGLSNAAFIRRSIQEKEVKEAPNADVVELIREIRRSGNNINQILKVANARGLLDVPLLRKALDENHAAVQRVIEAYAAEE